MASEEDDVYAQQMVCFEIGASAKKGADHLMRLGAPQFISIGMT